MKDLIHALCALFLFLLMMAYMVMAIMSEDYQEKSYLMLWSIWALMMSRIYEDRK